MKKIVNITKAILTFPLNLVGASIKNIDGPIGDRLRWYYWRLNGAKLSWNVRIDTNVSIVNPKYLVVGSNTWIDKNVVLILGPPNLKRVHKILSNKISFGSLIIQDNCHISTNVLIQAHGGVFVGESSGIASNSCIYSLSHHYRNLDDSDNKYNYKYSPMVLNEQQYLVIGSVILNKNCGIGVGCSIMPGVEIGENSWITINSYVIKNVPSNTIASGSPINILKAR
ncbi:MAG: acyltransferase [Candidatus Heimdallarchaeota archaeon]|nr:acyltransferase [Candidatus Heimdallarchaeota archaeon]